MSRVQLALNVTDLDAAVEFYQRLLGTEPHKLRPGYANFAVADPPLKLILMEGPEGGTLNHLGVEVETVEDVDVAQRRLAGEGLETLEQRDTNCCYAVMDKVWAKDPDGAPWEIYAITDDSPAEPVSVSGIGDEASAGGCAVAGCCG